MFRLTWKGLLAHKLRFALTALSVMLGVSFLTGTNVLTDTITKTFNEIFANAYAGTDAYVRARSKIDSQFGTQRARIDGSLLPQIRTIDGVVDAQGTLAFYAQMVDSSGKPIGKLGRGAPTFGFNWVPDGELSPWKLVAFKGVESAPPASDDQVVIDKASAELGKLEIGGTVRVLTQVAPKEYTVVGVATFGTIDSLGGASAVMMTTRQAQRITAAPVAPDVPSRTNQFDAIAVASRTGISQEEMARRVRDVVGDPVRYEVLTGAQVTAETQSEMEKSLSFFRIGLTIFAYIALFVSIFIIFNTFSIVVAQRLRELALLRAIGASGRQVMLSVLGEAVMVGLFASAAGVIGGVVVAAGLKAMLAGFGIDIPTGDVVVARSTVLLAMVVGTLVTTLSAILPARRASKIAPVAAMREVVLEPSNRKARWTIVGAVLTALGAGALFFGLFGGPSNGIAFVGLGAMVIFLGVAVLGPTLARPVSKFVGWPIARLRGITGELARDNAVRNPRRTALTAAALMIGVALVALITIFAASTKASVSVAVDRSFKADYVIDAKGGGFGGGFSPQLAKRVAALDEVSAASGLRFGAFKVEGGTKFLGSADPKAMGELFDIDPVAGDFPALGVNEIAISTKIAKDLKLEVGSSLAVQFLNAEDMTVGAIYAAGQRKGLSDYFISLEAFDKRYTERIDNQVLARLAEGVTPAAGKRAINEVLIDYPTAELQDQAEFKQSQLDQINMFVNLIYALLALAVIIAGIGIANTLALSIVERTRELGLLRAIGMTRAQLRAAVRWEAVIISLFGAAMGLSVGLFFGWAIVEALKSEGITEFVPPGPQLLVVVAIAVFVGVLFALLPARRAARLDILKAIEAE